MDYIKYAILAGLAAVSYLLLLAWQEDYPPSDTRYDTVQTTDVASSDIALEQTASDIPTQTQASAIADDIPVVSTATPAATTSSSGQNAETLITVRTDVLNVTIDRTGGDIVAVSLPQHATHIDTPDEPFVLLESGSMRNYVAQSEIGRAHV